MALLSGGFDSAVAAWQLLKRGVALDYVFCNLGGETHLQGVLRVARILACRWSYGDRPALHAVDFAPARGGAAGADGAALLAGAAQAPAAARGGADRAHAAARSRS